MPHFKPGNPPQIQGLDGFWVDDSGQDLVEYGLLCAFFALVGLAAWRAIELGLGTAYQGFDAGTQSLAEPPEPNGN